MKSILLFILILSFFSCREKTQSTVTETIPVESSEIHVSDIMEPEIVPDEPEEVVKGVADVLSPPVVATNVNEFIPKGFVLFEKIYGDLDKDGVDDCVLIIKGTNEECIIEDEYRGTLDRNRRGIIIALHRGDHYELVVYNTDCFSSENEDGGVYFALELSVEINRGILSMHYSHGRYGWWAYKFRYQNDTFELIGYDSHSNYGPVGLTQISINFSTGKIKKSLNLNADKGVDVPEKWEVTWDELPNSALIDLNRISDIDDIYFGL